MGRKAWAERMSVCRRPVRRIRRSSGDKRWRSCGPERGSAQVADELGVSAQTLRNWRREAEIDAGRGADPFGELLGPRRGAARAEADPVAASEQWWRWSSPMYSRLSRWLEFVVGLGYSDLVLSRAVSADDGIVRVFGEEPAGGYAVLSVDAGEEAWLLSHWPPELIERRDATTVVGRLLV